MNFWIKRACRLLTLLFFVSWGVSAGAQTIKIATIAPEGSFWMVEMRAGAKVIEERTGERVKFKFYGGGVQGNDKQVVRKMRIGQLHGATFTSGTLALFSKDAQLYSMPMAFRNMDEVFHVREYMDDYLRNGLEQAGMVNFGLAGAGMGYLMSNEPAATLADLSGQKIWVQEGDQTAYSGFETLGISPTTMPITDVLTGLQTELLDGAAVSPVGAVVLQLHTKLSYITDLPLSYVYGALVIDKKPFSRLSEADQAVVREVMEAIYKKIDKTSISDNTESLAALVEKGLKMVSPVEAEIPVWRQRVADSNLKLAKQGLVSEGRLQEMRGYLEAYRSGNPQ
jgi:TRAP-type C4-dicarboxylate transport system substrate-binding protein